MKLQCSGKFSLQLWDGWQDFYDPFLILKNLQHVTDDDTLIQGQKWSLKILKYYQQTFPYNADLIIHSAATMAAIWRTYL